MKAKSHRAGAEEGGSTRRQSDTQREITNFMRALSSYPDQFADNPYLSFEQHLCSIASIGTVAGTSSRHS